MLSAQSTTPTATTTTMNDRLFERVGNANASNSSTDFNKQAKATTTTTTITITDATSGYESNQSCRSCNQRTIDRSTDRPTSCSNPFCVSKARFYPCKCGFLCVWGLVSRQAMPHDMIASSCVRARDRFLIYSLTWSCSLSPSLSLCCSHVRSCCCALCSLWLALPLIRGQQQQVRRRLPAAHLLSVCALDLLFSLLLLLHLLYYYFFLHIKSQ